MPQGTNGSTKSRSEGRTRVPDPDVITLAWDIADTDPVAVLQFNEADLAAITATGCYRTVADLLTGLQNNKLGGRQRRGRKCNGAGLSPALIYRIWMRMRVLDRDLSGVQDWTPRRRGDEIAELVTMDEPIRFTDPVSRLGLLPEEIHDVLPKRWQIRTVQGLIDALEQNLITLGQTAGTRCIHTEAKLRLRAAGFSIA